MLVLGIETSCDESSVAVVEDGRKLRSLATISQVALHTVTGGVVPEVAAREHVGALPQVLAKALADAGVTLGDIDRIAVTRGPGLIGSLLVGVTAARALAQRTGIPLVGVHHIRGHMAANWLGHDETIAFPIIVLTVSGGHNELVLLRSHEDLEVLGSSLDDAAGEAFDKVARLLGLGYPGGPAIQKAALDGDPHAVPFPRAWLQGSTGRPQRITNLDFSFSGLKTAVRSAVLSGAHRPADIAASFQEAVVDVLASKAVAACMAHGVPRLHLSGGVSANTALRERAAALAAKEGITVRWPKELVYCTDNAAMIAAAGAFRSTTDDWRALEASASLPLAPELVQ